LSKYEFITTYCRERRTSYDVNTHRVEKFI